MNLGPLETLMSLRKRELEKTERDLAMAVAVEKMASDAVKDAEQRYLEEREFASRPECDDFVVSAFAQWMPQGRATIRAARQNEQRAAADRALAQTAMSMARAAHRAVEIVYDERRAEVRRAELRKEQQQIDELWRPSA
ncbi:hypothetical protein AA101099_3029 [Neoasaia chiangmaiensis NBRC 101099]|uniref:Uncharacterized protein n=1 Tax=Neoasaia chiangmaiensis TaxID=320497 RepID=A0A1U9KNJ8_9PROT|nr:hypothetical protein [Neoasaia chiangmaiensis]AQS87384.1 hypothetical protein A0U93_04900 [Neoasaia chiangmaiensis]GBR42910.1 hypothetical protein AA101099_3029 [Neoasaia chiangmaiensis NBRC 101099]GEN16150.1 hypothetical protein NCH01_25810 [Neoasaia chiangmaiensis]